MCGYHEGKRCIEVEGKEVEGQEVEGKEELLRKDRAAIWQALSLAACTASGYMHAVS
jgi:hypothetical protein